jgi:FkbM family methyltransferase
MLGQRLRIRKALLAKPIVFIGAGQLAEMSLKMWPDKLTKPHLILDNFKVGEMNGIEIANTKTHIFSQKNTYILSAFKLNPDYVENLFTQIGQRIITVYDIFECFEPHLFTNGWYGNNIDYLKAKFVRNYFSSVESKNVFSAAINWKCKRKLIKSLPLSNEIEKYSSGFFEHRQEKFDFLIDAGSFNLHLLESADSLGIQFDRYIAIEPDPIAFDFICEKVKRMGISNQVRVIKKALAGERGFGSLIWSGLLSAKLILGDAIPIAKPVEVTTLEEVLRENGVLRNNSILVKLHIEGFEYETLKVSAAILSRFNFVGLMVNLSHNKDSLLKIPRLLHRNGFKLRLVAHSLFGEGITLYAEKQTS